ncbi:MAG: translation initiation factor IF-2 [Candidatus Firestonebacteria bacterium]|nr:translation initiation factor IF-2 [Candidatus Firestonebacteria bacterium]
MSRVHEIATEIGINSKELIEKLNELGIKTKSHMSSLDDVTIKMIHKIYTTKKTFSESTSLQKEINKDIPISVKKSKTLKPKHEKSVESIEIEKKKVVKKSEKIKVEETIIKPINVIEEPVAIEEKIEIEVKEKEESIKQEELKPIEKAADEVSIKQEAVKGIIKVNSDGIIVSELAQKMNILSTELIKKMISLGIFAAINQKLDIETAILVASEYNYEIEHVPLYGEDILSIEDKEEDASMLKPRPPVVTVMGHVDHGKTKLLDAIRSTNIMDHEAGGITQHIGAYKVELKKGKIVFLDTPGHAAFTAMRARGAQVTDIVILVVAADDGVMPQTIEAIDHAKSAQVPIIVAVNKIDKPEANPEKVKRQLAEYGLIPEEWGGKTIFVEVSAKQKIGLDNLLEMILLEAEMLELKANPDKMAKGVILEAKLDRLRGPVASVLIQEGVLRIGDVFVSGFIYGKVRAMNNDLGKKIKEAGPGTPIEILGCSGVPQAGDLFQVARDEKTSRQISMKRQDIKREKAWGDKQHITLEDLYKKIQEGNIKELNIIIKADVQGSVEALSGALEQLSTPQIKVKVIHGAPGNITETDIILASAANAIIIGFNVKTEPKTEEFAAREDVEIKIYSIIYEIINVVKLAMEGMLEPLLKEVYTGKAEVREVFRIPKLGNIAGSYVLEGEIIRNACVKILRQDKDIFKGKLNSLKRFKDDVKSVQASFECGIGVDNFQDFKAGDIIEAYRIEHITQKL